MTLFLQQILNGVIDGSVYCLIAIGITLVFGLTGLVNFAHGEFMMIGAYLALLASTAFSPWLVLIIGVVGAFAGVGAFGVIMERTLFARTIKRPINGFIVSLGLILILQNLVAMHWGTNPQILNAPLQRTNLHAGGITIPAMRLIVLGIALGLSFAFYAFLNRTRIGTAMRCCNLDRDTATLMGINVPRMQSLAFGVGSALAGSGGVLLAMIYTFNPFFGATIVVKGFIIALAGGIGNVAGAFYAAILFGICEALTVWAGLGAWSGAITFGFVIGLLLVKPTGLLSGSEGALT